MEKAVLFSAIDGQVILHGKPLAGATLMREWNFAEQQVRGHDETTTDARGAFQFPAVVHDYRKPRILAQQTVITQVIRVKFGTDEWRVWAASKRDMKAGTEAIAGYAEGSGPTVPLHVTIDLDSPLALRGSVAGHTLFDAVP